MPALDSPIFRNIGLISRSIQSICDVKFKKLYLTKGQFIYLTRVCENPGISQAELTNILKIDKASTTKAIQKLEKVGFIERSRDSEDQRIWRLYPLPKGIDTYNVVIEEENRFIDICLTGFTEEEKALTAGFIQRMAGSMDSEWSEAKSRKPGKRTHDVRIMRDKIKVVPYHQGYQEQITSLILSIQRGEFQIPITIEDQPDLSAIEGFYQDKHGNFFVALDEDTMVGTIGLIDIGNRQGALRKMFVRPTYRGADHNTARLLLRRLLEWAREQGLVEIYLGTTPFFKAAHRFYEKNGFEEIAPQELPEGFPVMKVDTKFYKLVL